MMKKLLLIPLIFILTLFSVNSQLLSVDDAVAVYRFEEGSGTVCQDSTVNNITGTFTGTTFITSKGNNGTGNFATRYDGVDDFCQVPNPNLNLTIPFSISYWVNKSDAISDEVFLYKNIVGTDTNFGIKLDAAEQITIFHRVDGETTRAVITDTALTIGEWVHVVALVNGSGSTDAFIYFDGIQQATGAGSSIGVDAADLDFYIGVEANLDGDFLGDLDEIYIFNFSLSDEQITDIFNNGIADDGVVLNETNLNVFQSKNPVEILESFTLFANYTNSTDGQPVLNATCFANSSIVGGGQAGFGRGVLGIGGLSTLDNAVHTQVNDIFGNNTLRVDIDGLPLGKASYGVNFRFHAHNQTPNDALRVFATCHSNLTFSNFTLIDQVNFTQAVISTSEGNDTIWGFENVVLFGSEVATQNCSIVFESQNTSIDKHWMIADTTTDLNLDNSFTSNDFGETYSLRSNAGERSPFVDAGFGLDVPSETTMSFNATSGLYFLPNIRHGRPFDFNDTVFCSAPNFENNTNFAITNVQDNVPPIVQITSIDPTIAVLNVENVTINWNTNDPELVSDLINVSFPNGSLVIASTLKPLILTPAQLTITGNYTVIAFANDTGGLFSLANATFEVADIDVTPPVITLIAPTNNSVNNTIPLPITFSVTDNFPNDIICSLSNSTTTFDSGTFTQATPSTLTLLSGFLAISQKFPNLEITCFDNSDPFNNSAVLNLNYTLDTIPPVIIPISPANLSTFNKDIVSTIPIIANCTDVPVFKFNITISNETDIVATFEDLSPTNDILSIDDTLDISNLGTGIYTVDYTCSDPHTKRDIGDYNIRKNTSNFEIKYVATDSNEFKIKYLDNSLRLNNFGSEKAASGDRYRFFYNSNLTETSTRRTFIFEILSRKEVTYIENSEFKGHFITGNNWIDFELGDDQAVYLVSKNRDGNWEVEITTTRTQLNFNSMGELNTATLVTQFEIFLTEQIKDDTFSLISCPLENLQRTILFMFFILLSFIIMIVAWNFRNGLIGALGGFLLLILSAFTYSCIIAVGIVLSGVAIMFIYLFIFRGVRNFQ